MNVITIVVACVISYFQIHNNEYNWITFMMTFAWGFSDGCVNTHSN